MATKLVTTQHCDQFRKSILELLETEYEAIRNQLNEKNTIMDEACLWIRFDQLRIMIAMADGKYKLDPNQKMGDVEMVELVD